MPTLHRELPLPRTWMLTVRALEVAGLLVVLGVVVDAWQAWQAAGDFYPPTASDGQPVDATLMQRVVGYVLMGAYGSPSVVIVAALCVAGAVSVLHLARPVENARVLRWEVLAVGGASALYGLTVVVVAVAAVFGDDPYRQQAQPGVITSDYTGPSLLERSIGVGAVPLAALVVLAAAALWWLRLPSDFDEDEDDLVDAATGGAGEGELVGAGGGVGPGRSRRSWRLGPAQDANRDDFVLDGVEVIEPVERLHPREDEGGSGSGYDDYLRRF